MSTCLDQSCRECVLCPRMVLPLTPKHSAHSTPRVPRPSKPAA